VLASPEYLSWSSFCVIVASYASLFEDTQGLPDLTSSSTVTNGSSSSKSPSSGSSRGSGRRGSSKSGHGSNISAGGSTSRPSGNAAGQGSNHQQGIGVSRAFKTWNLAALAAWEGPMQQQHALPASHLELLSFLGFSKEVALWVAACWACRVDIKVPSPVDFMEMHPCHRFAEAYADVVVKQLAGADTSCFSGQWAHSIFHSPTKGMFQRFEAGQQQPVSLEYATLRYQLCVYLPAVLLYWVAAKQHSDFGKACNSAGMCGAFIASVPASNIDSTLGTLSANQDHDVSEAAISDTVLGVVLVLSRLQQLRHLAAEPASGSSAAASSSKGSTIPTGDPFDEMVMMTLLSMLAPLPWPQLPSTSTTSSTTNSTTSSTTSSTNTVSGGGTSAVVVPSPRAMSPECWKQHATAIHRAIDSFMRGVLSMTGERLLWDDVFQPAFLEGLLLITSTAGEDKEGGRVA
jgi:hypothetical protein